MREFAEQEIVVPDGNFKGLLFRCKRQPFSGLWFDAVDSGRWTRFAATGPRQTGKTLCALVIPLLYHLCQIGETVICALPNMDMAADKWNDDILPVFEASRYRDLLPKRGSGSRGGTVTAVRLTNGATLRFMTAGGGDKSVAGFTSRVLVISETDGFDESRSTSREADRVTQFEACTLSFGSMRRVYLECTVSIETGRIWREWAGGTASRIMLPCPKCRVYVSPGRKQLIGWEDAENEIEAGEQSRWCCPECGATWTEEQRVDANQRAILLHRGQEIGEDGVVVGKPPVTSSLGFRWSAFNNLFWKAGDVGMKEWNAARDPDEDNADREMCQFWWCVPHKPPILDTTPLDANALTRRVEPGWTRGRVPDWTDYLTVGADVHKRNVMWIAVAWKTEGTGHVVDYGVFDVTADEKRIPIERAILIALRELRDMCLQGWTFGAENRQPDQVWLDHGYQGEVVDKFCRESREGQRHRFRPAIGRGIMQQRMTTYARPKKTGSVVRKIGEGYHLSARQGKVPLVEVNADYWKTWVHQRLSCPADTPGTLQLFSAPPSVHYGLCQQLTAEKQVIEMIPGKGEIRRWERLRRSNHYLDCAYNGAAAAHLCGVRLIKETRGKLRAQPTRPRMATPDGRAFLVTER